MNILNKLSNLFKTQRVSESFSYSDLDEFKYKKLSSNYDYSLIESELSETVRNRMFKIVFDLHIKNPLAKRILEISRDFICGDGIQYDSDDSPAKNIINEFWHHPLNNFDIELPKMVYDLSLWGELIIKCSTNPFNGLVTISCLDPTQIKDIKVNKENIKDIHSVDFHGSPLANKTYNVIKLNDKGFLDGDIFYYRINNLTNQVRGLSDLLPLVDWLDAFDKFLFSSIERSSLLNAFVYHIQWIGLNKEEVQQQMQKFGQIKPASIHHTNENVKINAITPDLKASDTSELARVIKNFILGGAGIPEHWFGDGGFTNLATAKEMGIPTFQKLKERQTFILKILKDLISYQIDQALICGRLANSIKKPSVNLRLIDIKENSISDISPNLLNLVNFVKTAVDSNLIDLATGQNIINSTLALKGFKKI